MNNILIYKIVQIVITLLLVIFVLLQPKGAGFTSGVGNNFGGYRSKRGFEKLIFVLTIIFALILAVNSIIIITLSV